MPAHRLLVSRCPISHCESNHKSAALEPHSRSATTRGCPRCLTPRADRPHPSALLPARRVPRPRQSRSRPANSSPPAARLVASSAPSVVVALCPEGLLSATDATSHPLPRPNPKVPHSELGGRPGEIVRDALIAVCETGHVLRPRYRRVVKAGQAEADAADRTGNPLFSRAGLRPPRGVQTPLARVACFRGGSGCAADSGPAGAPQPAQPRCMGCVAEMRVLAWKRVSAPTRPSSRRSERSLLLSQKRAVRRDRCW
jgi:hypothetical protein